MGEVKCGATHYAGCACHEARHAAAVSALEAELEARTMQRDLDRLRCDRLEAAVERLEYAESESDAWANYWHEAHEESEMQAVGYGYAAQVLRHHVGLPTDSGEVDLSGVAGEIDLLRARLSRLEEAARVGLAEMERCAELMDSLGFLLMATAKESRDANGHPIGYTLFMCESRVEFFSDMLGTHDATIKEILKVRALLGESNGD